MRRRVIEIIVIGLITILVLIPAYAAQDNCNEITLRAYECQFDRQYGTNCQWQPQTQLELTMFNALRDQPLGADPLNKAEQSAAFAREWRAVCVYGLAN